MTSDQPISIDLQSISQSDWFGRLEPSIQELVSLTVQLYERERAEKSSFVDYSFVLFPMSKAYEGFIKLLLFKMQLISEKVYFGRKFRVGRALNPDLPDRLRDKWWLYDDVVRFCGEDLAQNIWQGWLECRNHVFHFFPGQPAFYNLDQIEKKIQLLLSIFEESDRCIIGNK